ncbi:uncharacterized protein PHACADRAFT_263777 [Phanerochaete carnosa HHB-10118-sp]|uniref:Cryptic loci regulator 2 N-terminal domain-containing protein n=1 Tax=Phanerochaete carnosa (strain HHB-10118-sp) TaxID=650164 RepID=K5VGX6_PHACS|nr:uncharacterized protein PHACADRAFT_263777 [Phanerochaete carnosa HHB-10118-sp]EKM50468.1 hypothetical protein PHACADRAFT_263777 [Phanerochaete carnosa HHB-10118-sp]
MSVRRIGGKHALPPNPTWVEIPRSDGDSSLWPKNTEKKVVSGEVNFMHPVTLDESLSVHWRKELGPRVAAALGLPSGPTYVLKEWPAEYRMFDHHKGPEKNPRHDAYLHGSKNVGRFRSVNEFVPHAEWLCRDPTMDRANCVCKYCTKRPQKEISYGLGLSVHRGSASAASQPTQRPRRAPPPKPPHTSVRKLSKPYEKPLPGPKQALSNEKDNDIRDCLTKREIQGIRYCRDMELVWCALTTAIRCSDNEDENIEYWPGVIEDFRTKAEAIPLESPIQDVPDTVQRAPDDAPRPKISWKPQQRRRYRIRLLATEHVHTLSDDDVLPYLAYAPPDPQVSKIQQLLPEALVTPAAEELANIPEKMSQFDPVAADTQPGYSSGYSRWKEAIVPYSLALQMASYMSTFWTPTDEWDCKFTINVPAHSQFPSDYVPSINDIMNGHANGTLDTVPKVVTQLRYQGLWWGAERIWTEELVRLKLSRRQFVPQGSDVVYPPASPSKGTVEWNKEQGFQVDSELHGSADKGLFMKIDGLFVVEVDNKDGSAQKVKECRASGMIYELVDHDWEPPNKGKERATDQSVPTSEPQSQATPNVASPGSVSAPSTPITKPRPILTATYPLPDPPMGYKFNPILPPGHEVVLSLSLISGRYYPHLFTHPRMLLMLQRAAGVSVEDGGLYKSRHIWAMNGMLPGMHQSMDPEYWKATRGDMVAEADRAARVQFKLTREQDHVMQDAFVPESSQAISVAGSSISAQM